MTTAIKRRRGTTAEHSTFVGLEGEITIDSTKDTVVVHDGSTVGGFPLAKENNATLTGNVTLSGGTANGVTYLNGSKVLTSGSGLTFDGTNLGVGTSSVTPIGSDYGTIAAFGGNGGNIQLGTSVLKGQFWFNTDLYIDSATGSQIYRVNSSEQMLSLIHI